MSRVGKRPVVLSKDVQASIKEGCLTVKGPKGTLSFNLPPLVRVAVASESILVTREKEDMLSRAQHGMVRNLIQNMVDGVTKGFVRELDIQGVGYRAELKGKLYWPMRAHTPT